MTDIKDISHADLRNFLAFNGIAVDIVADKDYEEAFELMKDSNSKKTAPIVKWMIARNLLKRKINMKPYSIDEVIAMSDEQRQRLAKKLTMKSDNIDHIIDILRYMHKLTDYLMIGTLIISKSANIYNIFPKEIWIKILMDLNCIDIDKLGKESAQFKKLAEEQKIKEQLKITGFPRKQGHCKSHDVSGFGESEKYKEFFMGFIADIYTEVTFDNISDELLNDLYELNYDLVRGDLILLTGFNNYRNEGIYIFDGCKIILLDYEIDDYGSLPNEFTVINNSVPVDYWYDNGANEFTKGISHNHIVYFDHRNVRDQCLVNIYDNDDDLFTTFEYGDKIYTIIASRSEYDDESNILGDNFIDILNSDYKLIFDNSYEFGDDLSVLELASYYYYNQWNDYDYYFR